MPFDHLVTQPLPKFHFPNASRIQQALQYSTALHLRFTWPSCMSLGPALDAIFLYQILGIAHKADVSTPGSAHHPNLSHMFYGYWGYWGYILY